MVRGQQDYGAQATQVVGAGVTDLAAHAAMLGSIVTYDSRGRVLWYDDFEGPVIRWRTDINSQTPILSTSAMKSGVQSLDCNIANEGDTYTRIYRGETILASSRLGAEISFAYNNPYFRIDVSQVSYRSGLFYMACLRFDTSTGKVQYLNSGGDYTDLETLTVLSSFFSWHTMKIVADFDTMKNIRALINEHEYDLSDYALYSFDVWADGCNVESSIEVRRVAAGSETEFYLDDFISTHSEP